MTASGSEPLVRLTRQGRVAELALDRPAALNAISTALATQLVAACAELREDNDCHIASECDLADVSQPA